MVERVEGFFYVPGASRRVAATLLNFAPERVEVVWEGGRRVFERRDCQVEPPLGGLTRVLRLRGAEGEGRFETDDQHGFRELEGALFPGSRWGLVNWLENHWQGAAGSAVALLLFAFAFLEWGVPSVANKVAQDMPQSWRRVMSEEGLSLMSELGYVSESELGEADREAMHAVFERALEMSEADRGRFDYSLHLLKGGRVGANAFAFPSGAIVATDEFVELCQREEQALAVFLHEIEHVEQQHGIRTLAQQASVFLVFSLLLGDAGSAFSLAEGLPALLLNSRYAQRFELESDRFAAAALEREGIGAEAMEEVLLLLHAGAPQVPLADLLSSHPGLRERLENIEQAQADALEE